MSNRNYSPPPPYTKNKEYNQHKEPIQAISPKNIRDNNRNECNCVINIHNNFIYTPNQTHHSHERHQRQQRQQIQQRQPKYHGPVNNVQKYKISSNYYYPQTGKTVTKTDYIETNGKKSKSYHFDIKQEHLDQNVGINELDPIPVNFLYKNSVLSRDAYFKEQKRQLENINNEKLLRLEAQRVYSHLLN